MSVIKANLSILPKRKRVRLNEYNYSSAGYYYVTLCAKDRECVFGSVVVSGDFSSPEVQLSKNGRIVEEAISYLSLLMENIKIDKYVIMPNHIHMIIAVLQNGASGMPRPTNAFIPSLISSLKRFTNKKLGSKLWQAGYYDHIVRNEKDYLRIWEYIDNNPAKWKNDSYYVE